MRKEKYRDMDKFRAPRNRQKRRYYGKTQGLGKTAWTCKDDELVLVHTVLSAMIGHSVAAIQNRRLRLKKSAEEVAFLRKMIRI